MEIKKDVIFEITKEERVYRFQIPEGAPLGDTYDVGWQFLEKILLLINDHVQNSKPKEPEEVEEKEEDNVPKSTE